MTLQEAVAAFRYAQLAEAAVREPLGLSGVSPGAWLSRIFKPAPGAAAAQTALAVPLPPRRRRPVRGPVFRAKPTPDDMYKKAVIMRQMTGQPTHIAELPDGRQYATTRPSGRSRIIHTIEDRYNGTWPTP